ncbi:MAG: Enoyl-[acyl-carrier-protein] reductase [FMN], partial [uncultured Solirubrobacteraceae bacterium]
EPAHALHRAVRDRDPGPPGAGVAGGFRRPRRRGRRGRCDGQHRRRVLACGRAARADRAGARAQRPAVRRQPSGAVARRGRLRSDAGSASRRGLVRARPPRRARRARARGGREGHPPGAHARPGARGIRSRHRRLRRAGQRGGRAGDGGRGEHDGARAAGRRCGRAGAGARRRRRRRRSRARGRPDARCGRGERRHALSRLDRGERDAALEGPDPRRPLRGLRALRDVGRDPPGERLRRRAARHPHAVRRRVVRPLRRGRRAGEAPARRDHALRSRGHARGADALCRPDGGSDRRGAAGRRDRAPDGGRRLRCAAPRRRELRV